MDKVKVWNDNVVDYKQKFRGDLYVVPAKGYIELDRGFAADFCSSYTPIVRDGMGQPTVECLKMLRQEKPPIDSASQVTAFKCHLDGSLHPTKEALDQYLASLQSGVWADADGEKVAKRNSKPQARAAHAGA